MQITPKQIWGNIRDSKNSHLPQRHQSLVTCDRQLSIVGILPRQFYQSAELLGILPVITFIMSALTAQEEARQNDTARNMTTKAFARR
jgi:hypothetical protein